MKSVMLIICLCAQIPLWVQAQETKKGKVIVKTFLAKSIEGNSGGENPLRRLSIYLPPGYEASKSAYPVIYFLHGFLANDSLIHWLQFPNLLDAAIEQRRIRPVIMVAPDSYTRFGGSFYTNSTLTGRWADFIGKDVVEYMDKNFRTLPHKNSRGLAGHSMGGHGSLKIGMLYPDVFGSLYALSPAVLNWSEEISISNPVFRAVAAAQKEEELFKVLKNPNWDEEKLRQFYVLLMTNLARSYSPNTGQTLFQADLPVSYPKDSMVVNIDVLKKWEAQFPYSLVDEHIVALKSIPAIKMDWGRNEENRHIPVTCLQFSKKLESFGIPHFAEEYIGGHVSKIGGKDGRVFTEMFPFFDAYLTFTNETNPNAILRRNGTKK